MKNKYTVEGVENKNPSQFGGMVSRAVALVKRAAGEAIDFTKGIETIATTEAPALVVDWERWEVVREILPMRYREAPESGKVPLLDSHNRSSIEKIKGSASDFRVDGNQLLCKTYISESEPVIRQKIAEGHIDSVSIGYMTDRDYTVEVPKGANVTVDGVAYRNDFEDGYPMIIRTWWKDHELSLVPIGADQAAKFKNDNNQNATLIRKINELEAEMKKLQQPDEEIKKRGLTYQEAQVRLTKYL